MSPKGQEGNYKNHDDILKRLHDGKDDIKDY
jgi:hypothetical protein